nr:biotin/lipoyl-binding protein [Cyanobacteriota bacterium]
MELHCSCSTGYLGSFWDAVTLLKRQPWPVSPIQAFPRLAVALLAASALSSCASKPQARQPPVVQVETLGEARFSPAIEVVSRLSSTTDVALSPEVDGRVVKILATQGQRVEAGQPILVLDNVQQTASLDSAKAEARKDFVNAERYIF